MFKPSFSITGNLLTYISSIESAKALIDHSPLVPAWEAKFKKDAMARTVHFGTKIEGNDLTQDQAQKVTRLELIDDPEEAGYALRFSLSQPITAAVSPSHFELLQWACDAADAYTPLTEIEEGKLKQAAEGLSTIFPEQRAVW